MEKPTNGGTITLSRQEGRPHDQNARRNPACDRSVEVIKELGGVKKFKELAEAMTVPGRTTFRSELPRKVEKRNGSVYLREVRHTSSS